MYSRGHIRRSLCLQINETPTAAVHKVFDATLKTCIIHPKITTMPCTTRSLDLCDFVYPRITVTYVYFN